MSRNYKINFKQLRQEALKDTFGAFERAMQTVNIDFYIIGALARDTWFAQKGIRALGTKDIDLAIFVSDIHKYEALKQFLVNEEGFTSSTSNEYVLFDRKGQQIDLLPFGLIEIEGKKIIDSNGMVHTNISGFMEVYDIALKEVVFEDEYTFKVCTLAGILILKLIAYEDRPEMRTKDIQDIGAIIINYFEMESELIYEKHSDLFTDSIISMPEISARTLGREMLPILNQNPILKERVLSILYDQIKFYRTSSLTKTLTGLLDFSPNTIEETLGVLTAIISGINDNEKDSLTNLDIIKQYDITRGYFTLSPQKKEYPPHPYSIFSKKAQSIRISGRSNCQIQIVFIKNRDKYICPITAIPMTPSIIDYEILVDEGSFINFKIDEDHNSLATSYGVLFFELIE